MGLKEGGMRGSLRNVSVGASVIPDSAIAHYVASNFDAGAGVWTDALSNFDLTATGGPQLNSSAINGEPAVSTDGVDDYLENVNPSSTQPNTFFIVVRQNVDETDTLFDSTNSNDRNNLLWGSGSAAFGYFAGTAVFGGGSIGTFHILTVVFDGANSFMRIDGTQTASGDPGTGGLSGFQVGRDAISSNYADADFAEIVPCNARVSDPDIQTEEQRLADKYGIALA